MNESNMQPKTQKLHDFPTEEVTLPSQGLLYPEGNPLRKGVIEMKYMTAREEDILTNQNYIKRGIVIDKLLQSLIVTPIDFNDLLVGDKNAILIASRILGYGSDYSFEYEGKEITIDLTKVEDINLDKSLIKDGKNEFHFTLPTSKIEITFKLMTQGDETAVQKEIDGLKKINKLASPSSSTRLKKVILSVDGDYERKTVREFVDNRLLAKDVRALRNYISDIKPDVDLTFDFETDDGDTVKMGIPIGVTFFWPDVGV